MRKHALVPLAGAVEEELAHRLGLLGASARVALPLLLPLAPLLLAPAAPGIRPRTPPPPLTLFFAFSAVAAVATGHLVQLALGRRRRGGWQESAADVVAGVEGVYES